MTKDEHKAWLDGLKPGDTGAVAFSADAHRFEREFTVVRRTAQRIIVKLGGSHEYQCDAATGCIRGRGNRYNTLFPMTARMQATMRSRLLADWAGYQAGRDIAKLSTSGIARVKALVDELLLVKDGK